MRVTHYRVGGHLFRVQYKTQDCDDSLIPSSRPFLVQEVDGVEPLLFELTVDNDFVYEGGREEVGQFDGSGNNYGVYLLPDGGYEIEMSNPAAVLCGCMYADKDFSRVTVRLLADDFNNRNFALNNALMMAYAFAAADKQTLLLHASVIRKDGYGYLMTAPSGTGKSTHTFLWYKNIPGSDLMNDDNPVVRILDGTPIIYGTPWSGKTPCYRNVEAPLGAITRIDRADKNFVEALSPIEAFASVLPSCSSMKWDSDIYSSICDTVTRIIETTGIYILHCLPDKESAEACYKAIVR